MQVMPWQCEYCQASYKREANYSRHILTCRLIQESNLDESENLPSYRELYTMVVHLTRKQEKFEKEMRQLKLHERRIRKKISYPDWLNKNRRPSQTLKIWTSNAIIQPDHFQTVVSDSNFMRGVTSVIRDLVPSDSVPPYAGFEAKPGLLYVFDDNEWVLCSDDHVGTVVNWMFRSLREQLNIWEERAKVRLKRDDYEDKYANNVKRIMGPSVGYPELCRLFRRALYDVAKLKLHNVIEYEFTT